VLTVCVPLIAFAPRSRDSPDAVARAVRTVLFAILEGYFAFVHHCGEYCIMDIVGHALIHSGIASESRSHSSDAVVLCCKHTHPAMTHPTLRVYPLTPVS
jgi:hypothetical protein